MHTHHEYAHERDFGSWVLFMDGMDSNGEEVNEGGRRA